ncbi:hypothetical protein J1605_008731 [Eschrichtius robustus]|uniref:Uncharacterized protein n=1 Tax=Eschrichtius robustus TaxID=9764 RepID=A0AB34GWQ3_ESCRO|nr:hypothetical protein J1605_008731 [Eschrichtius robustus]
MSMSESKEVRRIGNRGRKGTSQGSEGCFATGQSRRPASPQEPGREQLPPPALRAGPGIGQARRGAAGRGGARRSGGGAPTGHAHRGLEKFRPRCVVLLATRVSREVRASPPTPGVGVGVGVPSASWDAEAALPAPPLISSDVPIAVPIWSP